MPLPSHPVERHRSLPSTQRRAVELARGGAPVGTTVVAEAQTGGIGRGDHTWWSPAGGLYLSTIQRFPAHDPGLLSIGVAAELADRLSGPGRDLHVKWPNDLVVPSEPGPFRKLGGVLVDALVAPGGERRAVVGVGLNVGRVPDPPPSVNRRVVSLADLGPPPVTLYELEGLTVDVVGHVTAGLETDEGVRRVRESARRRLFGKGRAVRLDGRPVGVLVGLADDGALRVAGRDGPAELRAGDLEFEEGG